MFSIHPDKAPGPDGFSANFFQSNWKAVGPAIIREIQSFFTSGELPSTIKATKYQAYSQDKESKFGVRLPAYRPM